MASKLGVKKTIEYKQIYLKVLAIYNGINILAIKHLDEDPDFKISWGGYVAKWKREDDAFNKLCKLEKESIIKKIENVAYDKAMAGDTQLLKFILERRGGWREESKQEVSQNITVNDPIKINIIKPDDKPKN